MFIAALGDLPEVTRKLAAPPPKRNQLCAPQADRRRPDSRLRIFFRTIPACCAFSPFGPDLA